MHSIPDGRHTIHATLKTTLEPNALALDTSMYLSIYLSIYPSVLKLDITSWHLYMRSAFDALNSILSKQPWIVLQDKTFTTLCSWIMILANTNCKKDGNGTYHYFTRMCLLILSSSRVISWSNSESTSHRWGFNSYKSWPISTLHTCTQRKNVGDSCFGKIRFTVDRGQSWTNLQDLRNYTIKTVRDTFSQPYQWFLVGITKSQMAG